MNVSKLRDRLAWPTMLVLSLFVAVYAVSLLVIPAMQPPFIRDRLSTVPLAVYLHLGASAVAIALGPFQFLSRLRARLIGLHRWIGRTYLGAIMLGGSSAFVLATMSQGGMVAHTRIWSPRRNLDGHVDCCL